MTESPIVVVTGGGRGIGRAIALAFAAGAGADLLLVARTARELEATAADCAKAGGRARFLPANLEETREIVRLAGWIAKEAPRVDVLVNNAGFLKIAPFAETTAEDWERTIRVNLSAPFFLTQALLPQLLESPHAHVFNILSVAAKVAFAGSSAYCASKAGLLGLNGVMREEFRGLGIKVTAVLPGATDTRMFDSIPGEHDRRLLVRCEDIAVAVLSAWRLSPEANVDEIQITTRLGVD